MKPGRRPDDEAPEFRASGQPTPAEPAPGQPTPGEQAPDQQAPGQPTPDQQAPSQPTPDQQAPSQPAPHQPAPGGSGPTQPGPDDPAPARQKVGVGGVLAAAAKSGRDYWPRILSVAIVVSIITSFAEITADEFASKTNLPLALFAQLSAQALSLLGAVFLSGFLSRLVGEKGGDPADASLRRVLRTLPWRRLIGADLLVSAIVLVGLIALIIPGLIAMTFFGLVGPAIEAEDHKIVAALRRSGHLVRGHFWVVALLVTLPVLLASELEALAPHLSDLVAVLKVLAIRGFAEGIAEAAIGLVVVKLTYRLIALDRQPTPPAKRTRA
jgi:uncharacterized membrane protein YhaH (DUF805 family)